jgi:hypothetical protein
MLSCTTGIAFVLFTFLFGSLPTPLTPGSTAINAAATSIDVDVHTELHLLQRQLASAGVKNPANLRQALQGLELDTVADLRGLDDAERAEMMEWLRGADVALGARSKLRWMIGLEQTTQSSKRIDQAAERPEPIVQHEKQEENGRAWLRNLPRPRRLQGHEGLSSDSMALMATATLGILSFMVQARVAARAREALQMQRNQPIQLIALFPRFHRLCCVP